MRIIDADVFISNVVKYSHQSTKTIGKALADTPTVQAVSIEVLQEIRQEIETSKYNHRGEYNRELAFNICLQIVDKHIKEYTEC